VLGMVDVELIKKMSERHHSIREISRMTGWSRQTVRKHLAGAAKPPTYTQTRPRPSPVMDPYLDVVKSWLEGDKDAPPKQRHTARRIYDRLVDEYGFTGAEVTSASSGGEAARQTRRSLCTARSSVGQDRPGRLRRPRSSRSPVRERMSRCFACGPRPRRCPSLSRYPPRGSRPCSPATSPPSSSSAVCSARSGTTIPRPR